MAGSQLAMLELQEHNHLRLEGPKRGPMIACRRSGVLRYAEVLELQAMQRRLFESSRQTDSSTEG
jgi:hypothetical protein